MTQIAADRLRAVNRPQPIHVLFADPVQDCRTPVAVSHGSSWKRIESVGEVWQIDDEWWRDRISRRYVEVVLQGGKHIALYEDLISHEWFVQMI